jgi:CheY-like chemotaxis protein
MSLPTILIVDDEVMVTQMIGMLLELSLPASVLTANSPVQALEILREGRVSLLLTDYLMPDLNGISLIRALRLQGSAIPAILLTGYCDEPELMAHAGVLAPFEVIFKPWNNEKLLQRIQYWLDEGTKGGVR